MKLAPKTLSPSARKWWRLISDEYKINDPAGLLLLTSALEAFDRMREAQETLRSEGATIRDRFDQAKAHPATVTERDSRAAMLSALKALQLDFTPPA